MKDSYSQILKSALVEGDPKAFVQFAETVAKNATIVSKYPFLLPIGYDGKCRSDYIFEYTEADAVPTGWHQLVLDMSEEIIQCLNANNIDPLTFYIDQLKEKFGGIRLYYTIRYADTNIDRNVIETNIDKIIHKYEALSEHTCCECGKEATLCSTGWICPYCNECAKKLILNGMSINFASIAEVDSISKKCLISQREQENAQQI